MEPQAEVMAEEGHWGPHAHKGLVVEGEDGQEQDGVGLEMERLDLIVLDDGSEELQEVQDEPREDDMEEEGVDWLCQGALMSTMQLYSCRHVLGLQAQSFVGQ